MAVTLCVGTIVIIFIGLTLVTNLLLIRKA